MYYIQFDVFEFKGFEFYFGCVIQLRFLQFYMIYFLSLYYVFSMSYLLCQVLGLQWFKNINLKKSQSWVLISLSLLFGRGSRLRVNKRLYVVISVVEEKIGCQERDYLWEVRRFQRRRCFIWDQKVEEELVKGRIGRKIVLGGGDSMCESEEFGGFGEFKAG